MTKREQRVLAYVNRLRATLGLKPLKRLPRGDHQCGSCPIAKALGVGPGRFADVDHGLITVCDRKAVQLEVEPPKYVAAWIEDFDDGRFPHLEARS